MILTLLLACAHDPPMRPMEELPVIADRGLAFSTEGQALDEVRRVLREAGFPTVDLARVRFVESVIFPVTSGDTVMLRRSLTNPVLARQHLDEVGLYLLGRPFAWEGWTEEDLWEAYQAFFVAALGHELAHVASYANGATDQGDFFVDEVRARSVEWPLLRRLAAENRVPERWLELYPRFLQSLYAEVPAESFALIAADPVEARAQFSRGYAAISEGAQPVTAEMQAVVGAALSFSIGYTERSDVELEALLPDFQPPGDAATRRFRAGLDVYAGDGFTWSAVEGGTLISGGVLPITAEVVEQRAVARLSATTALSVPPARETEVLRAINLANQGEDVLFVLGPEDLTLRTSWLGIEDGGAIGVGLRALNQEAALWLPELQRVARGERSAAEAAAAVELARAAEEAP